MGSIAGMQVNGGIATFRALQPKDGPGVYFWANQGAGKYHVAVTYVRASNL